MDHNLEDSLTLEGMDFDHSEDVVNQEDIPLEDSGRLDNITMDMDVGEQSHTLMEADNDEVIISDLIEDPFPFQEYTIASNVASGSNIMIDQNQLNQLMVQHDPAVSLQTLLKVPAPTTSNVVTLKMAQPRSTKRLIASAPPRQVAIAPKPLQTKPVQYAIAPKPIALISNKNAVAAVKKVPAQIGRQLVMVPKKIKLMSSIATEGVINSSSAGLQYQVACTQDQAQLIGSANKASKPLLKFIQLQGQSSGEQTSNSAMISKLMPANAPRARYVMQQKTVPISIGGNKLVQNLKIQGKKQIVAIQPQTKVMQAVQGKVATKKVVISSNSSQKVLIRTNAPTSTTQVIKDTGSIGQRTQFHPINVPGKGIQYIKLVTNQPAQKTAAKPVALPSKNFVFTDSKGNVIQMTAEKVAGQTQSIVVPGSVTAPNKAVVKALKTQKKLVRIAPVSKAVAQSISQPVRSSQSLLAPIATVTTTPAATTPMTSLPSTSPVSTVETVSIEEFNDMVEQNDKSNPNEIVRQSHSVSNYIDNSHFIDGSGLSENEFTEEYSTADDTSHLHEETVEDDATLDETVDVKPTLQSLITDAVNEDRVSEDEQQMRSFQEVEFEFEKKHHDTIRNTSFMLGDENMDHNASNTSGMNEESIIVVPTINYDKQSESMYSDDSISYRNQRLSVEDRKNVPLLSVETECVPYTDHILSTSPPPLSEPEAVTNLELRPRKACNCTKSQCLKLYCDCFANGEFCNNCNCNNCYNNLENEEIRQKAIRSCLERNPNAFRPKIGKSKTGGPEIIVRHTKGCNCKRSGCLKNYCECYEAKIACTTMCKCVGCRNVEETLVRRRDALRLREKLDDHTFRPAPTVGPAKQPCSFMTTEVIEAVCQCLIAAAGESDLHTEESDPVQDVIEEFARCLQDVIAASHHTF